MCLAISFQPFADVGRPIVNIEEERIEFDRKEMAGRTDG